VELLPFALFGTAVLLLVIGVIVGGARRLLGLQIGVARTALACFVALFTAGAVARSIGTVERHPFLLSVVIGSSLLVTMAFLMVAELLVPHGTTPVDWFKSLRRWTQRSRRYGAIVSIIVRHGLGPYLGGGQRRATRAGQGRDRLARHLRLALEEGGVTFVKLGQLLSTRRDLLPPEFITELSRLQAQVPAADWDEVRELLVEELGTAPADLFASFDAEPLGAASIAQVHRATLRSGAEVVVKVQRPGIRPRIERDLDILGRLAHSLHRRTAWARNLGVLDLAQGFADALTEELNFQIEATNISTVRATATHGILVPTVHADLSTARVLVMEHIKGEPLGTADLAAPGVDRRRLADNLLACMLEQIMIGGVFHCDPHPGNVLLLSDGRLALLDFGVVGRIDAMVQLSLQDLLASLDRRDRAGLCDALIETMSRPEELDEQRLERALGQFMASHLSAGVAPQPAMFVELFRIIGVHGLRVPPAVAAVFRAVTTLEGTLALLAPGYDTIGAARTYSTAQVTERLKPTSLRQAATDEALKLLPMVRRFPRRIDRITSSLEQGRLGVSVRLFADERDRTYVSGLVRQVTLAFLGAVTGIMAVLLLGTDGGPRVTLDLTLFQLFGYNLLVLSAVLILRTLVKALSR
jgi:ubiquinone biosynthesis protein